MVQEIHQKEGGREGGKKSETERIKGKIGRIGVSFDKESRPGKVTDVLEIQVKGRSVGSSFAVRSTTSRVPPSPSGHRR